MADDTIQVQITADTSDFEASMQNACSAAQASFAGLQQTSQAASSSIATVGKTGKQAGQDGTKATADWIKSFDNLNGAFSSSITGMILGTETWQKAVKRLSQTALTDLVNVAQQQLAKWIESELGMTAATTSGNTTRAASDKASQSGFFTLILQTLAQWLGLETDKTTASVAGNDARNAAEAAAAAASATLAVARGLGMIQISAAEAAAAAFADSASLGVPGLAAAPAAATAAYTATLGWASGLGAALVPSSAGGLWNVPSDMLAMVHKQETILPAGIAQPMRDFFSNGASGQGGGGDNYTITVQAIDTQSGAQFLMSNAGIIAQGLARELRNGNATLRSAMK